jgi:hypothetical protein
VAETLDTCTQIIDPELSQVFRKWLKWREFMLSVGDDFCACTPPLNQVLSFGTFIVRCTFETFLCIISQIILIKDEIKSVGFS